MAHIQDHIVHIPYRIRLTDLECAGLAQCCCGQVALLQNWRAGRWPRSKQELAFSLLWELAEEWREPEQGEIATLSVTGNDMLAESLEPSWHFHS